LEQLYEQFKEKFEFKFVYILEAHAEDEWPICSSRCSPNGKPIRYFQTKTIQDRITVAKEFIQAFQLKIPLIVDNIHNSFENLYAPWPLRIFIVENGILKYKAQPGEKMLLLKEFIEKLEQP